jgi:hypothetical protein
MPQRAQVTSVDALESFRAKVIVYVSKARPTLEEVSADVLRMRVWLENEQRMHWENQVRKRKKELEQAQAALFSARISNLHEETAAQQMAFHRARRELDDAETKLRVVKRWAREFDARVQPLVKQMEKLHTILTNDMVLAVAYLAQAVQTLEAYAGLAAPTAALEASPAAGTSSGTENAGGQGAGMALGTPPQHGSNGSGQAGGSRS